MRNNVKMEKEIKDFLWKIGNDYNKSYSGELVDEARNLFLKYNKNKVIKVKRFIDFEFNEIDCMINENGTELGFFKSCNDKRPSSATYIDLEEAEHLYKIFTDR